LITVQNLNLTINKKLILNDINFTIKKNSITQIFGPNGAGKTSLFKIISGIITDYSGKIIIDDTDIKKYSVKKLARKLTFLPQFHYFSLPITVKDILISGRFPYGSLFKNYSKDDIDLIEKTIETFKLSRMINRDANTLSGGEIKQVMLASAFIQDVPIILLDEPFISLDPKNAVRLRELIGKLHKKDKTIIIISHRMEFVYPIATDIIAIKKGDMIYSGKKQTDIKLLEETLDTKFEKQTIDGKDYLFINE